MPSGDELLIVDGVEAQRNMLRASFEEAGYVCTAVGSTSDAQYFVVQKFFPAALIELDLDRPGGGLELVRWMRERSPKTTLIVIGGRRAYGPAVEAFRLGAMDVVLRGPEELSHLKKAVEIACDRYRSTDREGALLHEVRGVLEEALRVMLEMARDLYKEEASSGARFRPRVLVVDAEEHFLQALAGELSNKDWDTAVEMNGGAALDKAASHTFDVVVARDELVDLKGSLVVRSIQSSQPGALSLVYSDHGQGRLERYVRGQCEETRQPFSGAPELAKAIAELVQHLDVSKRDRRIMQAFRSNHAGYLRRYAEIKLRIDRVAESR